MLGVHGGDEVVEGLAGRLDPRLDAGGKFDVGESAGGLQLAHGVRGGGAEGGVLPELGGQEEDGAFLRGELTSGSRLDSLPIR